jgi:hypothetical protein
MWLKCALQDALEAAVHRCTATAIWALGTRRCTGSLRWIHEKVTLLRAPYGYNESPIKWTQGQIITFKEMPSNLLPCDSSPILALKVKMLCGFSQKSCNHSRASARNMWRNALSKHQHASTRNVRSEKGQRTQPKLSAANGLAAKTPNSSSCPAECWPRTSASSVATRCAVANRDHNTIQDIQAAQKKDFEVVRQG